MPMRPTSVRVSSAAASAWIPLNRYATSIAIALGVVFSSNKNLTVTVDYATDPLVPQPCKVTRVTTTATLTLVNHGLSIGDSIVVSQAGAPFDGTYAVATVTDQNVITYTVTDSGSTGAGGNLVGNPQVIPLRVQAHPVLSGITANADSNFSVPPTVCRLRCSSYTAGYADLNVVPGSK